MGTKFAVPPMFFLTKLDEALILYKRKAEVHRVWLGGRAKEEGRKSEGKANCHKSIYFVRKLRI